MFIQNTTSSALTSSPLDHFHGFSLIVTLLPSDAYSGGSATDSP